MRGMIVVGLLLMQGVWSIIASESEVLRDFFDGFFSAVAIPSIVLRMVFAEQPTFVQVEGWMPLLGICVGLALLIVAIDVLLGGADN